MTLVALANALLDDRDGRRGFTWIRASAPPSCCCRNGGRARCPRRAAPLADDVRVAAPPPLPVRRYRTPHTVFPHAQFLSNGRLVSVVTNAGGGSLLRDGRRRHAHRAATRRSIPGSVYLYLRDVWSGDVWSATYHPTAVEPDDYLVDVPSRPRDDSPSRRDDRQPARHRRVDRGRRRGPPARDHQPGHAHARDRRDELRRDRARRAGGRSRAPGVRQAVPRDGVRAGELGAALSPAPARSRRGAALGAARAEPGRAGRRARSNGKPTARSSSGAAATRDRPPRSTAARSPGPQASCSIRFSACASASGSPPGATVRLSFATGVGDQTATRRRRSRRSTVTRRRRCAPSRSRSGTRRARCITSRSRATTRCCSSGSRRACCSPTARSARAAERARREPARASRDCGGTASPAICRSCSCASSAPDDLPLVRQVLQAQEYWRLKGLEADVVILNERTGRLSGRHADAAHRAARRRAVARLAAAAGAARTSCAATRSPDAERTLLESVARAVLSGDRGDLADAARPAVCRRSAARRRWSALAAARARRRPSAPVDRSAVPVPPLLAGQRAGRLRRRRPRLRHRAGRRPGDAGAVGERHREPGLRHDRDRVGGVAHVG